MTFLILFPLLMWLYYHELIARSGPADGLGVLFIAAAAALPAFLLAYAVQMLLNHARALYIYVTLYGWPNATLIQRMWRVKDNAVEGWRLTSAIKGNRVPSRTAILVGLLYSLFFSILALIFSGRWFGDLFFSMSLVFLALVPNNPLFHGRPPAVLLLGHSSKEALELKRSLIMQFVRVGISSLLRIDDRQNNTLLLVAGTQLRTRESVNLAWEEAFQVLAEYARAVVIDCREITPLVQHVNAD